MKNAHLNILIAAGLILMAGVSRILNAEMHIYNLAPVAALGLFSGAVIRSKSLSYLFPLLALFLSDLFFALFTSTPGFYGIEQVFVYAAMAAVTFLGTRMGQPRALRVLGFTVAGSLLFFIVSNLGVWFSVQFGRTDLFGYGKGLTGLLNTFAAALPFYRSADATQLFINSFAGDLVFSIILFGTYYLLQRSYASKLQKA